jgi:ABC-type amino acid transport substrate-binding protein
MHLYLHRSNRDLVEPLSEALRSMKEDGTYDEIVRRATSHLAIDTGGKD